MKLHDRLSKLYIKNTQMNSDATSLYPTAMFEKNSIYPKIDTGYPFKPLINDIFINCFDRKTFNQDGNESAILKRNSQPAHFNMSRFTSFRKS